jgi:uncharacterized protein (DUF433 family)
MDGLTSSADVCGGLLRVEGTRVTLHQLVVLYKRGESVEGIASHYPQISRVQVIQLIPPADAFEGRELGTTLGSPCSF